MKGNFHVRFLEEGEGAISPSYSAIIRIFTDPCISASSAQSVFYLTVLLLTDDEWTGFTGYKSWPSFQISKTCQSPSTLILHLSPFFAHIARALSKISL